MLQKGIIEKLEGKYRARVRVPKYDKMSSADNGTSNDDLPVGIVCALPEMKVTYSVGDTVLVAYENDELSKPVILGLLYTNSDTDSTVELGYVDETLEEINDKLTVLEDQNMYMHVKYSNDNGATFTSLFDYDAVQEDDTTFYVYSPDPIEIDPYTQFMQWNIIDSNNRNVTDEFVFETSVDGRNTKSGFQVNEVFTDTLFKLPITLKACDVATVTFTIKTTAEVLSNYYVSLSTDRISIGDAYGDYIGIFVSNDATPSLNTSDYTWTSVKERSQSMITSKTDNVLDRVRQNEQDLRGYSEDILDSSGNIVVSNTGLLDAINVSLNTIVLGLDRKTIYFSNSKQYIDSGRSSLHINSIVQGEFNFERYAIITPVQEEVPNYVLVKPFEESEVENYFVYTGGTPLYRQAQLSDIRNYDGTLLFYIREEDGEDPPSYTYEVVKLPYDEDITYYTKSGDNYEEANITSQESFVDGTPYYYAGNSSITIVNEIKPHLRLTFIES